MYSEKYGFFEQLFKVVDNAAWYPPKDICHDFCWESRSQVERQSSFKQSPAKDDCDVQQLIWFVVTLVQVVSAIKEK